MAYSVQESKRITRLSCLSSAVEALKSDPSRALEPDSAKLIVELADKFFEYAWGPEEDSIKEDVF